MGSSNSETVCDDRGLLGACVLRESDSPVSSATLEDDFLLLLHDANGTFRTFVKFEYFFRMLLRHYI